MDRNVRAKNGGEARSKFERVWDKPDTILERLDKLISRDGPCRDRMWKQLRADTTPNLFADPNFALNRYDDGPERALLVGGHLEDVSQLVEAAVKQARDAKDELRSLVNESTKISDVVLPYLIDQVKAMRDARFALTSETAQCMASLKEVRKFFVDADYHTEITRLKEFLAVMERLKQFQSDGTLDAIVDAMLKLAIGGEHARK